MANTITSVSLDIDTYTAWKQTGLKLGHIVKLGIASAKQTPGYIGRIRELEEGNDKLQKKLTFLMARITELEKSQ